MLNGLVAMCIVPHVHYRHLTYFVNHLPVIAVIENRRNGKHRVKHRDKHFFTSHQVYQPLRVMKNRPGIMPTVSLGKCISPLQRRERFLEFSVPVLAAHQLTFGVEKILIVQGTFGKESNFFLRPFQFLCQTVNAPVIVCILQCAGSILVDVHIVWDITQTVIVFIAQSPGGGYFGMHIFGSVQQPFIQAFHLFHTHTFHISIH